MCIVYCLLSNGAKDGLQTSVAGVGVEGGGERSLNSRESDYYPIMSSAFRH